MSRYFGRRWQRDWSVFRHKIVVLSRQVLRNVLLLYHYPRTFSLIRYFEDHCFVVLFPRVRHLYVVQVLFLRLCCFWGKKGKSLTFNRRQILPWRPHLRQSMLFLIFSPELSRYLIDDHDDARVAVNQLPRPTLSKSRGVPKKYPWFWMFIALKRLEFSWKPVFDKKMLETLMYWIQ